MLTRRLARVATHDIIRLDRAIEKNDGGIIFYDLSAAVSRSASRSHGLIELIESEDCAAGRNCKITGIRSREYVVRSVSFRLTSGALRIVLLFVAPPPRLSAPSSYAVGITCLRDYNRRNARRYTFAVTRPRRTILISGSFVNRRNNAKSRGFNHLRALRRRRGV